MPKRLNDIPKLTQKKQGKYRLARLRIGGKDFYCGAWGSPESKQTADRIVSLWLAAGRPSTLTVALVNKINKIRRGEPVDLGPSASPKKRVAGADSLAAAAAPVIREQTAPPAGQVALQLPDGRTIYLPLDALNGNGGAGSSGITAVQGVEYTILHLSEAYKQFADDRYVHPNGEATGSQVSAKWHLEDFVQAFGQTPISHFSGLQLDEFRRKLAKRKRLTVTYLNAVVSTIRRMFRWGASRGMVPTALDNELRALEPVRPGQYGTRQAQRRQPVTDETISETLPWLPPMLAAMVKLQRYTGMRPSEVFRMRPKDLTKTRRKINGRMVTFWDYKPPIHKTGHHASCETKIIPLGPVEIEILAEYVDGLPKTKHIFTPLRVWRERQQLSRWAEENSDSLSEEEFAQAHFSRRARKPAADSTFCRQTYYEQIKRAITAANAYRDEVGEEPIETWHPYQMRHTFTTESARSNDLKTVSNALGHATLAMTEEYLHLQTDALRELAVNREEIL